MNQGGLGFAPVVTGEPITTLLGTLASFAVGSLFFGSDAFASDISPKLASYAGSNQETALAYWYGDIRGTDASGSGVSLGKASSVQDAENIIQAYANQTGKPVAFLTSDVQYVSVPSVDAGGFPILDELGNQLSFTEAVNGPQYFKTFLPQIIADIAETAVSLVSGAPETTAPAPAPASTEPAPSTQAPAPSGSTTPPSNISGFPNYVKPLTTLARTINGLVSLLSGPIIPVYARSLPSGAGEVSTETALLILAAAFILTEKK